MASRVSATPQALEAIERLRARHGAIVIHQSGGCCDGSSPICLPAGELPAGPAMGFSLEGVDDVHFLTRDA
jgi:uncharacterized protein (DUF779 family)